MCSINQPNTWSCGCGCGTVFRAKGGRRLSTCWYTPKSATRPTKSSVGKGSLFYTHESLTSCQSLTCWEYTTETHEPLPHQETGRVAWPQTLGPPFWQRNQPPPVSAYPRWLHSPKMCLSGPAATAHPASSRPRSLLGPLDSYSHQPAFRVFPDAVLHVVALLQGLPLLSVLLIAICVCCRGHVGIRGT